MKKKTLMMCLGGFCVGFGVTTHLAISPLLIIGGVFLLVYFGFK